MEYYLLLKHNYYKITKANIDWILNCNNEGLAFLCRLISIVVESIFYRWDTTVVTYEC